MNRHPFAWIGIGILVLAAVFLLIAGESAALGSLQGGDVARLAAAVALLIVIGGGLLFSGALSGSDALRYAVVWLAILLGLVLAYSYRGEFMMVGQRIMGELVPGTPVTVVDQAGRESVLLRRAAGTHFAARGAVNGTPTTFLVDTGATRVTLTATTALAAGIAAEGLDYTRPVRTANGVLMVAATRLDRVEVGELRFHDVGAFIAPDEALSTDLLGVNLLDRLESYEVRGDEMVLRAQN